MTTGVLTTSFPRYPGDFAGCFVEDAVGGLVAAGDDVEVIAASEGNPTKTEGSRPDLAPGVRVLRVTMPKVEHERALFFSAGAPEMLESGGAGAWAQAFHFWAAICDLVRQRAPSWDRIIAHWLVPCALAARAVAPHLPLTAHAHSGDIALLERIPGGRALGRWLVREPTDLIFVSADLRERFSRLTGISVGRVEPAAFPGVRATRDPRDSVRAVTRQALGLDRRTILSVGRLVPIKGFDILLRALALAAARSQSSGLDRATVAILGDGPERPRLEALAERLDVDLRLPGFVPRGDVSRWMTGADLYVQPSRPLSSGRTEGLPVAAIEAVQAGLPVLVAATGGLRELPELNGIYNLQSQSGSARQPRPARPYFPQVRLFSPEDPSALADSLIATGA